MWSVIKWAIFVPISFLSSIAAWLVAPIAPFFAHEYSLKGTWLWWSTTPNTNLLGDPDHRKRWEGRSVYLQQVTWILRNPSVNFQRETLGVHVEPDDRVDDCGVWQFVRDPDEKLKAWMFYLEKRYGSTRHGLRVLLGWKVWDAHVKDPLQMTCRITPWKTME